MSSVDSRPKPPRSFSDDAVAALTATINSIMDAVDGARSAVGPAPSTEEEAFRYNLARDRGIVGAFNAARVFSPVTPGLLGRVIGRGLTGGSSRAAIESPSPATGARGVSIPRSDFGSEPYLGQPSLPTVPAPSISPQGPVRRSEGLLGRLRELDELEGLAPHYAASPAPLGSKDPNFRQLSRVNASRKSEAAPNGVDTLEAPRRPPSDKDLDIPEFLRRQRTEVVEPPVEKAKDPGPEWYDPWSRRGGYFGGGGSGGGGNGGGKRRRNDDDDDDDDLCSRRSKEEFRKCLVYKDDSAHPDYFGGCKDRSRDRWRLCFKNNGKPHPGEPPEWRPGSDRKPGDEETWLNHWR